jgi:GntP family gluconate:H+ symporter
MLLALVGVTLAGLFLLLVRYKVNPLIALIAASIFMGLCSGMGPVNVAKSITQGMGAMLSYIAIVIGFGTMMSKLMAECGGADVIARRLIAFFGEKRVNWAIAGVALIIGISVFFQVGVVLLIPLVFTIAMRMGGSLVFLVVPLIATLTAVHHWMPPHPAPMAIVNILHANLAKCIIYGIIIAIPVACISGPLYGTFLAKRLRKNAASELVSKFCSTKVYDNPPPFAVSVLTMLCPILLMLLSEIADFAFAKGSVGFELLKFIGDPNISLFVSVVLALYTFGFARGFSKDQLYRFTSDCLGPVAMILLILGAGGSFGRILVDSGVAKVVTTTAMKMNIHPLILAWGMAGGLRFVIGSGTVSMITTAGLVSPLVTSGVVSPELMVAAIGAGGNGFSFVNDSGFWTVKEFFGFTTQETLKVWTGTTIIGSVVGICIVGLIAFLGF